MTTSPVSEPRHLDGNALAGPLSEVFRVDLTAATRRCAVCGITGAFAELRVYAECPGLVVRCPGCDTVVLRLVHEGGVLWIDLGGTGYLRLRVK
ncbi:DUF6510 family protein [Marinactinospora thermotolerans]|uniref:DUF6510 family protein n=1 Tax=Marinactinospora thermotolerans TaxID=531310 RepID=UPI003D8F662E